MDRALLVPALSTRASGPTVDSDQPASNPGVRRRNQPLALDGHRPLFYQDGYAFEPGPGVLARASSSEPARSRVDEIRNLRQGT